MMTIRIQIESRQALDLVMPMLAMLREHGAQIVITDDDSAAVLAERAAVYAAGSRQAAKRQLLLFSRTAVFPVKPVIEIPGRDERNAR